MKMKLGSSSTATDARPGATPRKRDLKKAFLLALAIHAALFVALLFAFQWKTQNEEVYAELWASVPTSGTSEQALFTGAGERDKESISNMPQPLNLSLSRLRRLRNRLLPLPPLRLRSSRLRKNGRPILLRPRKRRRIRRLSS
jgi:hypothetical protein